MQELLSQAILEVEKAHAWAYSTSNDHPAIAAIEDHLTTARMYFDEIKQLEVNPSPTPQNQ